MKCLVCNLSLQNRKIKTNMQRITAWLSRKKGPPKSDCKNVNIIEHVYSIMKDISRIPSTIRETKHSTEIPVHMVNGKMVQPSGFLCRGTQASSVGAMDWAITVFL